MIRSAKDVIEVARSRGLRIRIDVGPPVMPKLVVPGNVERSEATDALMNALKIWRLEIIEEISKDVANGCSENGSRRH